jgi:hypothetical protein
VVTAVPLVALVVVVIVQLRSSQLGRAAPRPGRAAPSTASETGQLWQRMPAGPPAAGSAVPWVVVLAALVAWELIALFAGTRSAHPTVSSIYDILAQWRAAKAAVLLAWLALGWYLVRR